MFQYAFHWLLYITEQRPAMRLTRCNSAANAEAGRFIAVRFVGGNRTDTASERFSARDGYGARATLKLGKLTILREHHCGEGLASQNSRTMLVGIGGQNVVDALSVRWPNGAVQQTHNVSAGSLVSGYENPADSPNETGFVVEPYISPSSSRPGGNSTLVERSALRLQLGDPASVLLPSGVQAKRQMYTTTATWCAACKRSHPQLRFLRESFREDELQMWGVPADQDEPAEKHIAYVAKHRPAYRLLTQLKLEDVSTVNRITSQALHSDLLPSTIITNSEGHVLLIVAGVPSLSQLRKLISEF